MTKLLVSTSDTKVRYQSREALPLIIVDSPKCHAVISLYGGQILEFNATGKPPLLWLSPLAIFEQGKAIRGGVPVCAPWFGPYSGPERKGITYPNHGFARTSFWQQTNVTVTQDGDVNITLALGPNELSNAIYPHQFKMKIEFTLSEELAIEFSLENNSIEPIDCEWALHSYFAIDDIATVSVSGLAGCQFMDKTLGNSVATLNGQLTFSQEVDRCFVDGTTTQIINCKTPIKVSGDNCDSVITWNPGALLAATMTDVGSDSYRQFVCVERGATFDKKWQIAPEQRHSATMVLSNLIR